MAESAAGCSVFVVSYQLSVISYQLAIDQLFLLFGHAILYDVGYFRNSLPCASGAPKRMKMVGIGIGIGIAIGDRNRLLQTNSFDSDCDCDPDADSELFSCSFLFSEKKCA